MQEPGKSPELDIVIPVYNEAENIAKVLDALKKHVRTRFRILICYDHDHDNTLPVVRNYTGLDIVLVKNQGKGPHGAVMTGFSN